MKNTKKRILSAFLAAAMAAALPVTAMAESLSETAVSVEYGAKKLPAPKNIVVSKTVNSITLKWDAVEGADKYRIYMLNKATGKYEKYKDTEKTSCKVTGLKPKTSYKFKIVALVEGDDGKYEVQTESAVKNVNTKQFPQPSKIEWSSTKDSVTLNWTAVTGTDQYLVAIWNEKTQYYEEFYPISETSYTVTGLSAGMTYAIRVVALTEEADGGYRLHSEKDWWSVSTKGGSSSEKSSEKSATTKELPQPSTVSLTGPATENGFTLKWSAVKGADRYGIYIRDDRTEEYERVGTTSKTSYEVTGLSAGTDYQIMVIALTKNADGSYTEHSDEYSWAVSTADSASVSDFVLPNYGDKKSAILSSMRKSNFTKSKTNGKIYTGNVYFMGELCICALTFDSKDRCVGASVYIPNQSYSDYKNTVDTFEEGFGTPYHSTKYEKMWALNTKTATGLEYESENRAIFLTTVYTY